MSKVATRRALYGKLAGDSTLTNMLGTPPTGFSKSIYYEEAPEKAAFPYVVFLRSSGTPMYGFGAGTAIDSEVWTIKGVDKQPAVSATADIADGIASRLDALLTNASLSVSGANNPYLKRESDVDYPEPADGVVYFHSGGTFRLVLT